jgi:anti-sigma-K factor RskA
MTDFRDLIGDDLTPEEEARLRRVHDLLVEAGPPPELSPELESLEPPEGEIKLFPHLPRRRRAAAVVVAAAVAAIAFGGGYLIADNGNGGFRTEALIPMHPPSGAGAARASIALGPVDSAGNWPLLFRVTNLPEQPRGHYYELWLTRDDGKRISCGAFRMTGKTTTVRLNAPYKLKSFDGWIVTDDHGRRPLLTT